MEPERLRRPESSDSLNAQPNNDEFARKIESYSLRYSVRIKNPAKADETITSKIWLTFNLESTLYSCEKLRNILGIYPSSNAFKEKVKVSNLKLNNVSILSRIGAIGQIGVTLIPKNTAQQYGKLGQLHKTTIFFNLEKSYQQVANDLVNVEINPGNSGKMYIIEPGSIVERGGRRRNAHFG